MADQFTTTDNFGADKKTQSKDDNASERESEQPEPGAAPKD